MIDCIALKFSIVPACQIYHHGLRNMLLHPAGLRVVLSRLFKLPLPRMMAGKASHYWHIYHIM